MGLDLERLEVTSEPVSVLEGVVTKQSGAADFSISQSGSLVYVAGPAGIVERTLVWIDREGREEPLSAEPRAYTNLRISPDGTRLALEVRDQENDLWIWNFARETLTRLTFDPAPEYQPRWAPDGLQLAFGSGRDGVINLFQQAADGTGTVERLSESTNTQMPQAFSPDGTQLVFYETHPETGLDLGVHSMDPATSKALLATGFDERDGEISPDGNWLAYQSDASGQAEIYVRPFPDVDGGRWQISRGGGTQPRWSSDGRELFYVASSRQLMVAAVQTDPVFSFRDLQAIGEIRVYSTYDVSPDGKRFLVVKEGAEAGPTQVILVQNWLDELKRLVPTR